MAKYVVVNGLTLDDGTDKEKHYSPGDIVEMTPSKAKALLEEEAIYPEGDEPPKKALAPNEVDPATGLLVSGEANADTPAHLLAPPEQVGPLRETYVPGEEPKDLAHPDPNDNLSPTVDDLTPEQVRDLTPEHMREPEIEVEATDDETGEVIEDVVEADTPVDEQEGTPTDEEDD